MTFSELTTDDPIFFPIMLFVLGNEIMERRESLSDKQAQLVVDYFHGLGFHSLAEFVQGPPKEVTSKVWKIYYSFV